MEKRQFRLTPREVEVLANVAHGRSSEEVASLLFVSKRTVDFHLANIYNKLKVHNRAQALHAAQRLGIVLGVTE